MPNRFLIVVSVLVVCAFAEEKAVETHKFTDGSRVKEVHVNASRWRVIVGDVCQIGQLPRPFNNTNTEFLECVHVPEQSPREDVGIWLVQKCSPGYIFSEFESKCEPFRRVRRQQVTFCSSNPSACSSPQYQVTASVSSYPCACQAPAPPQASCMCSTPAVYQPQPVQTSVTVQTVAPSSCGCQQVPQCPCAPQQPVVQPQPCPQAACTGGVACAVENGICSWMLDPLVPYPGNKNCFMQCQPAPYNVFCGRWRKMPCALYTMFDPTLQVCVHDPNAPIGPLPPRMPAPVVSVTQSCGCSIGINIGQCGSNYQCPGMSQCQITQTSVTTSSCSACCYFGQIMAR